MRAAWMIGLAVFATAGAAHAQWGGGRYQQVKHELHRDYQRTAAWPQPFIHMDRSAVRAPWHVMAHNGWRAQNTLTEELFDEDLNLTEAGRRKVIWIATQAPEQRRTVYILATDDQQATQARTEAVRNAVARLADNGIHPPEMMMTTRRPLRWSGDYYDRVEKMGREAISPPVLPAMVLTTEGG